jgi:hypothetical protein
VSAPSLWQEAESAPAGHEGLVYCVFDSGYSASGIAEWCVIDGEEGWFDSRGDAVYCVTHWMPLPEPPK